MAADISIPLILGTDSASDEFVKIDLARTGNLLLAGATKQGKSHCIHNLIRQIETLAMSPEMILFDPKKCEFGRYKDKFRVIETLSDAKTVLFSELFNEEIFKRTLNTYQDRYSIVIVIDELLDLIFMHKSRSKQYFSDRLRYEAIIKILTLGPEYNIFTIISTQTADKDILTKEILDSFKTRLAFRTINGQDSRRIIKKSGAENLLGKGDAILYQEGKCRKIQCP
ncbi:MAG: hypothetical protein J6A22_08530 [Bacteroidales bacterium]|nr:hypothetical protein [Bacteroidales bacterium]